jgi:uncharacterized membrane protein YbaN (DUF454 family)
MSDELRLPGETTDVASEPEGGGWRIARAVAGIAMITLGVVGCLLPIIPGVPFLVGGVALLGTRHPLVRPFAEPLQRWRRQRDR